MVEKDTNSIFVDIDGVITTLSNGTDYSTAEPNYEMINIINRLYDAGYNIVFYSARGSVTGIDWRQVTEEQLQRWGVKYDKLMLSKPFFWYLIDDRTLNPYCNECRKRIDDIINHK